MQQHEVFELKEQAALRESKIKNRIIFPHHIKLIKQRQYCNDRGIYMFAPADGKCFCGADIEDCEDKLITGCNRCHTSFCE